MKNKMDIKLKTGLLCLMSLFLSFNFQAQEIRFQANVSKNPVAVGEAFRLNFTINAQSSRFSAPDLSKFELISGPSQSTNMQIINGQMSQNFQVSYVLTPKNEGTFVIGPASVTVGNGIVKSNEITLTVKGKVSQQQQNPQQNYNPYQPFNPPPQQSQQNASNPQENIYIKAIVSKTKVYQGEQFSVVYKLYSKYNAVSFSDIKFPSFSGFYSEELAIAKNIEFERETINGQVWLTATVKKSLLMAQKSGKLDIPSLEMTALVRERTAPRDIFEQMFGGGVRDVSVKLKSKPTTITIEPHPINGKPAAFTGAVGDFSIEASIDKSNVKSNDAVTLKINLSGKGGFKLIDDLKLNFPDEFEVYDPQIKDKITHSESGSTGSRTFEYLIIPKTGGKYELGPFSFSYFNPASKSYKTISTSQLTLDVERSKNDAQTYQRRKSDTQVSKETVTPIYNDSEDLKSTENFFWVNSSSFYSLLVAPPVLFILLLVWKRKKLTDSKNSTVIRKKKALQKALNTIESAQKYISVDNQKANQELLSALQNFISEKFELKIADFNTDEISKILEKYKANQEIKAQTLKLLSLFEMAKYAPQSNLALENTISDLTTCLKQLNSLEK